MDEIKEKVEEVISNVKEEITEIKEKIVEKVEDAKDCLTEITSKKNNGKQTWWNRIISAIVGAIIAAGATYGITATHISEQKERVSNIKELSAEALTALKNGDIETAKAALELAKSEGTELAKDSKEVIDNIKNKNNQ
jgi:hypothetical protein